jgi:transposase
MKSKAYRAVDVNVVDIAACLRDRTETVVHVGLDIGKESILSVVRWSGKDFDRPWRVRNPFDVERLAECLRELGRNRQLVVSMEPTGTYGDALRQALERKDITVHRVSPKSASDFAEVFDGVPSQHDGKDAAVVAELAAQGRCWPWPIPKLTETEQELAYQVRWMDGQRREMMLWCGRLEGLVSRYWPEAAAIVALTSGTLLQCLARHGGPGGLAAAADALDQVRSWGGTFLSDEKAEALVASARVTVGVAMGRWDEEELRRCAQRILGCRKEARASQRRLEELTRDHETIRAMGEVVGVPTACVLWMEAGDPRLYSCGAAYRKGMGLNLSERSSGKWEGKLKISKRGSSRARRWLYLAALRWVKDEPVKSWYTRQKAARRGEGKPAVVGVMRKLALVLYRVGGCSEKFDRNLLYRGLASAAK